MVSALEKQGLVTRERVEADRRRVTMTLTPEGHDTIETLCPAFNSYESAMSGGLTADEKRELARLLRVGPPGPGRSGHGLA